MTAARKPSDRLSVEQIDLIGRALELAVRKCGEWDDTWREELNALCDMALRSIEPAIAPAEQSLADEVTAHLITGTASERRVKQRRVGARLPDSQSDRRVAQSDIAFYSRRVTQRRGSPQTGEYLTGAGNQRKDDRRVTQRRVNVSPTDWRIGHARRIGVNRRKPASPADRRGAAQDNAVDIRCNIVHGCELGVQCLQARKCLYPPVPNRGAMGYCPHGLKFKGDCQQCRNDDQRSQSWQSVSTAHSQEGHAAGPATNLPEQPK